MTLARAFTLTTLTLALALTSASAFAQSPAATLARAVAAYNAASTIRIQFEQTLTNALTGNSLTSHGTLVRKKPNLLSIDFAAPAKDRVVADGVALWMYMPSSAPGQVIKLPASDAKGAFIDPLGQILSVPADRYTLTDAGKAVVNSRQTHAVALTPKRGTDALFTQATVWIDDADAAVRQIEVTEPSGVTRKIRIVKFTSNVTIPRSAFTFTPPVNVRVIDGAGRE